MIDNSNIETRCCGIIKGNESGDEKQPSFPGLSSIYIMYHFEQYEFLTTGTHQAECHQSL